MDVKKLQDDVEDNLNRGTQANEDIQAKTNDIEGLTEEKRLVTSQLHMYLKAKTDAETSRAEEEEKLVKIKEDERKAKEKLRVAETRRLEEQQKTDEHLAFYRRRKAEMDRMKKSMAEWR